MAATVGKFRGNRFVCRGIRKSINSIICYTRYRSVFKDEGPFEKQLAGLDFDSQGGALYVSYEDAIAHRPKNEDDRWRSPYEVTRPPTLAVSTRMMGVKFSG